MNRFKTAFNSLPSAIKVAIYVGLSASIAVLISSLEAGQPIDVRAMLVPVLTIAINVLAFLIVRED